MEDAAQETTETAGPEVIDPVTPEPISTQVSEYSELLAGLAEMRHQLKDRAFDLTTVRGNDEARRARKQLVTTRTTLDKRRDELKRGLRASVATRIALLDSEADRLIGFVRELETPIDQMIEADDARRVREKKERDDAEAARQAGHRERIQSIADVAVRAVGLPSNEIFQKIGLVTRIGIGEDFEEFRASAINVKAETILKLQELHSAALDAEVAAAQQLRDRERLAQLERENQERMEREAAERRVRAEAEAQLRRDEEARQEAQRRVDAARAQQSTAANALVDEIRRVQKRAFTASAAGLLELVTLIETIRIGDELGDFAGVAQKSRDDALAELHEMHAVVVQREADKRRAEEDAARTLREMQRQREAEERSAMALQQIQGIQQQVAIARSGRLGVREGGTIQCIRDTLAETEAWVIDDENFGALKGVAQMAKDTAVAAIQLMLRDAVAADAQPLEVAAAEPESGPDVLAITVDPAADVTIANDSPVAGPSINVTQADERAAEPPAGMEGVSNGGGDAGAPANGPADGRLSWRNDMVMLPPSAEALFSSNPTFTRVPVRLGFDATKTIGMLEVLTDQLPPHPNFVFALGYKANVLGSIPKGDAIFAMENYVDDYELQEISLVTDASYLGFLINSGLARPPLPKPVVLENDERADINVGTIKDRLGFALTADFLATSFSIACETHKGRGSWYRARDFGRVCDALIAHAERLKAEWEGK